MHNSANLRYKKPTCGTGRAGGVKTNARNNEYRGFEIRGTGIGFCHIYFRGNLVDRGVASVKKAKTIIDRLIPNLDKMGAL